MKRFLAIALAVLMTASLSVVGMAEDSNGVYLFPGDVTLRVNDTKNFSATINTSVAGELKDTTLTWTSSNEAVATVDSQGVVTAVSTGDAVVRATTADGNYWGECDVTVVAADAPAVTIDGKASGETLYLKASINDPSQMISLPLTLIGSVRSFSSQSKSIRVSHSAKKIFISPADCRNERTDVGDKLTDTLTITLWDKKSYSFPVEIQFTDDPVLSFPNGNSPSVLFLKEGSTTYTLDILDVANIATEKVQVSFLTESHGNDEKIVSAKTRVTDKQILLTLTPLREGKVPVMVIFSFETQTGWKQAEVKWTLKVTGDDPADDPYYPGHNPGPGNNDGGDDKAEPSATDNTINTEETIQAIAYGDEMLELKVTNGSAGIGLTTMDTLGNYHTTISVQNGSMRVDIPGGFGKVTEPGRIYYPMDFMDNLANAADLAAPVKGDNAKTEVVKAGGDMVMPTTVTVTLKTRLTGTVNVYYYNPETRRYTLIASPTAQDGKITFATKQMGTLVLTTGTI